MINIWDFFRNLFSEADQSSASRPLIHESIQRSESELAALEAWKDSLASRRITSWLADQYAIWQVLPHDIDPALDFLNTPSSKGFAIHFHQTEYGRQEAVFLLDLLKEKVLTLNYKPQLSDTRTWTEQKFVHTAERHYLKPRPDWSEDKKFNQQFGNITIELQIRDDQPRLLTFRATSYSDRLYDEPGEFQDLMQVLLS